MKPIVLAWLTAVSLVFGQQFTELDKFYADYAESEQRTVALYPDAAVKGSSLSKKMGELEQVMKAEENPLYHSAEKPLILAVQAAKELGVMPVGSAPIATDKPLSLPTLDQTESIPVSGRSAEWVAQRDLAWRQLQDYYPEYCNPGLIEKTYRFVAAWDSWAKVNRPDVYDNPRKPIIYCSWQKAEDQKAAAELAAERAAQLQADERARAQAAARAQAVAGAQTADANSERRHQEQLNAIQAARSEANEAAKQAEIDRQAEGSARIMRMRD